MLNVKKVKNLNRRGAEAQRKTGYCWCVWTCRCEWIHTTNTYSGTCVRMNSHLHSLALT